MQDKIIDKLRTYSNIAILGFGKEGMSTYNFIRRHDKNIKLTIMDAKEIEIDDINASYKKYNGLSSELDEFDLIIKTPGISLKDLDPALKTKMTSQMQLLLEVDSENVIGITGTKGKSTTSTLLYNVLKEQMNNVYLVGNIGVPVLDEIENYNDAVIVAEMSSHQLETVTVSPHIGIILNMFLDHLDHAGSPKNYHNAKMNMFRHQKSSDYAIYDLDNYYLSVQDFSNVFSKKLTVSIEREANIYLKDDSIYLNGQFFVNRNDIKTYLLGDHNLKNIMFVLLVASLFNLDIDKALNTISNFKGLEHRMEYVGEFGDIKFYNDSIATIPEATINAVNALKDVDTLIFGGMDRNIEYGEFIKFLNSSSINHFICNPTTGYKIAESLDQSKVIKAETLEEAVNYAFDVTEKGKICLLSPAASSYEYFKNFEEKGSKFKELVSNHFTQE